MSSPSETWWVLLSSCYSSENNIWSLFDIWWTLVWFCGLKVSKKKYTLHYLIPLLSIIVFCLCHEIGTSIICFLCLKAKLRPTYAASDVGIEFKKITVCCWNSSVNNWFTKLVRSISIECCLAQTFRGILIHRNSKSSALQKHG